MFINTSENAHNWLYLKQNEHFTEETSAGAKLLNEFLGNYITTNNDRLYCEVHGNENDQYLLIVK
jgi:hypothetical protein